MTNSFFLQKMKRLQCIGKLSEVSSKDTEKETAPIKPECATPADPLPKKSVEWKPKQQKPKPSGMTEVQDPTTNSVTTNPTTFGAQNTKRQQKPKSRKTERQVSSTNAGTGNQALTTLQNTASGGHNAPKAPSFKNVTTHGHKVPKQVVRVMTEQQATPEVHLGCRHELQTLSESDPNPPVEQREEEESEENETAEGHVPLELFAEFLDAVMTKNYQLAKKLCQMILIYDPQNSEAKSFLPLIEEKLLIETEESSDNDNDESAESDTSDEEEEEDSSDDEDTDDNESSDTCDTDEESTDSTDDTSSSS
ncbi:glutamate-rich protein 2 isoform X2 [Triplophysa dalaica]|uniref:glutamate-rich protein 2 isoform X2 n=1 Tax=Triplophysa dalaica TaxID=1582913 RepID=UPI0024DF62F9|nr:glutamate-rich protein 2 isoform X2 [Triplophysa dalaica]